jgi:hypothetical protein
MNIYRLIPMGQKVPSAIKEKVINAWLEAKPRNIIADETDISYGSVTNIITEVKRESIKDIDLLRAVAVLLKRNGLDLTYLASTIRLKNRLDDLKLNETQADSFLEEMAIHCFKEGIDPKDFLFQIGRVCSISEYLNIPIMKLPDFIEEKTKENKDPIE